MPVASKLVKKVLKGATKATSGTPMSRVVDSANTQELQKATDELFFEFNQAGRKTVEEYQATQAEINTRTAGTIEEVSNEQRLINEKVARERGTQRKAKLFDASSDVDYTFQTNTPAEFSVRLNKQLKSPDYAADAVLEGSFITEVLEDIKQQYKTDDLFQKHVAFKVFTDRTLARAEAWLGDSPYTRKDVPYVFVHIDRQSDPLREQGKLVQFEFPRELGVHSGTNRAANQATIKSPSRGMQQIDDFDVMLDEIAGFTDDPREFKNRFARTTEQFFIQKFSQGEIYDNSMWDELVVEVRAMVIDLGGSAADTNRYFARAKQLPTANSTPHLFRGKNGLYLKDEGGFGPETVGKQLLDIFPEQADEIEAALGAGGTVAKNKALQQFIESRGYDHVVYHNSVEDRGTLSIINWKEELWAPLYGDEIIGTSPDGYAKAVTAMIMGSLGLGAGSAELRN